MHPKTPKYNDSHQDGDKLERQHTRDKLMDGIALGEQAIEEGKTLSHEEAKNRVKRLYE